MAGFDFSIIRTLRMKQGLSAEELARAANLTRATIAKIEAGGGNPTMGTIEALAGIFHLLPSELVRMAEVSRCEEAMGTPVRAKGITGRHVRLSHFELFHLRAGAGAEIKADPKFYENTAEVCYLVSGSVRVTLGEASHTLKPGAALGFKALLDHRIDVREDSELLFIHHSLT